MHTIVAKIVNTMKNDRAWDFGTGTRGDGRPQYIIQVQVIEHRYPWALKIVRFRITGEEV